MEGSSLHLTILRCHSINVIVIQLGHAVSLFVIVPETINVGFGIFVI
jgi:hypothetical protein